MPTRPAHASPRRAHRVRLARLALAVAASFTWSCGGPAVPSAPASTPPAPTASAPSAAPPATSAAAASPGQAVAELARRVVDAPDRAAADRALDAGRRPAELLTFFRIGPGMRVGEIMAGTGYTTELLARAVGPEGRVFAQNNTFVLSKFAEKPWGERLAKPENKRVVRVDRELEEPFPPEAKDLDCVIDVLFYHDSVWMKTDRAKMNRAVFAALRPGGVYGIVDHASRAGAGTTEAQTLHRIEEKVVRDEILSAGFVLDGEGAFLRNPADARDWSASPGKAAEKRGTSDRFVLRFVKPAR